MPEKGIPEGKGTYVLVIRAREPVALRAGALGRIQLPRGWLMYVGSAMGPGGLRARVGRHFAASGRPRWHVDHLVRVLRPVEAWVAHTAAGREALWLRGLLTLSGVVPAAAGFGASDSAAPTHLVHSRRRPSLAAFRACLAAAPPGDEGLRRVPAPPTGTEPRLEALRNLGPASAGWLREAGIHTREELARLGPVEAYLRVQETGRRPSLNLLYAIAGALEGCRWDRLPEGTRGALLLELDAHEAAAVEGPWERR